jgi:hypothetical protein
MLQRQKKVEVKVIYSKRHTINFQTKKHGNISM